MEGGDSMIDNSKNKQERKLQGKGTVGYIFNANNFTLESPLRVTMTDIEFSGAAILINHKLEKGSIVNFEIGFSGSNFTVVAEVVWCNCVGKLYECGVEFRMVPEKLMKEIEFHLQSLGLKHYTN